MNAFDPSAWLTEFDMAGGWFALVDDGRICLGWRVDSDEQTAEARNLYRQIEGDEHRRDALRSFIARHHRGLVPAANNARGAA